MTIDHSSDVCPSILSASQFVRLLCACLLLGAAACSCEGNEQGYRVAPPGGDLQHAPAPRRAFDEVVVEACGQPRVSKEGEEALLRRPYLQQVEEQSADLVWVSESSELVATLREPVAETVIAMTLQADASANPRKGRQWWAHADGLRAATLYCYEIFEANTLLASGGLRTAPASDASVRFSAMGDLGKASGDQREVLAQLKTVDSEFIAITGDLAYDQGTLQQFEDYFFAVYRDYAALVPFFPASGNHDYGSGDADAFRQVFRLFENGGAEGLERWYSFDWGPVHMVVLDTQRALPEQAEWLREDLAASDRVWKVVVLHKPPYASGHHGSSAIVQEHFVPVFEELGVDLVLAGHEHHYERTIDIGGVVYVITGGGGRGTRPVGSSSFTAFAARVAHFVYIEASPAALTLHAIDASGVEFDSMQLVK